MSEPQEETPHVRFTESQTAWHVVLPAAERSPWQPVGESVPPEGAWCWVWDGSVVALAKRDTLYACGWMMNATGTNARWPVTHWLAIAVPVPPSEDEANHA